MDLPTQDLDSSVLFGIDSLPPYWTSDTDPDNPWYIVADYAVHEASYASSGPPHSASWAGEAQQLSTDSPLQHSLSSGQSATLDILLYHGNDMDSSNESSESPPHSTSLTPPSSHEEVDARRQQRERDNDTSKNTNSRKRPFDDLVTCFPSNEETKVGRTKAAYTKPKRKQVAFHRTVGTCSRCYYRRVTFTFPKPCQNCVDVAGSTNLARWVCVRESFHELRFGSFDLLFESFTQEFLQSEIQTFYGQNRQIRLTFLFDTDSLTSLELPVTVCDYSNEDSTLKPIYHTMAVDNTRFELIRSDRYAIIPGGIPSLDDLLRCVQVGTLSACGKPVERLITALQAFMCQYSEDERRLPLNDLLASSVKVLKLLRCWRSRKMVLAKTDELYIVRGSKAMSSQILKIIKEGIRNEELFILKSLEKPMYGAKGPGKENMIPLWACLWSLILTYRDSMNVYRQYSAAPRTDSKQPNCSSNDLATGACRRMYDMLTANYAALFRTSTPLYSELRVEDNPGFTSNSGILKDAFNNLRAEFFSFYQGRDDLGVDDWLLRDLIVDQEKDLGSRIRIGL